MLSRWMRGSAMRAIQRRYVSSSNFDIESAVEKVGENLYRTKHALSDAWSVGDAPNGGFLMYVALQAATHTCQPSHHPDPLSFTAYYISKAQEQSHIDLHVRLIGRSKSSSSVHVTMSQDGVVRSEYMGTFGDLSLMKGIDHSTKRSPAMPAPQDCMNASTVLRTMAGDQLKIAKQLELRIPHDDPCAKGFFRGKSGDTASFNAWVSLVDQRLPCLSSMAFFLDALPPPVMNIAMTNWVPTLEYTVHFWQKPTRSDTLSDNAMHHWLRAVYTTSHVNKGLLYTDGEIWSHDGKHLLATSRQLARWMAPKGKLFKE
jgi:acyl-CoA thioesterase